MLTPSFSFSLPLFFFLVKKRGEKLKPIQDKDSFL